MQRFIEVDESGRFINLQCVSEIYIAEEQKPTRNPRLIRDERTGNPKIEQVPYEPTGRHIIRALLKDNKEPIDIRYFESHADARAFLNSFLNLY